MTVRITAPLKPVAYPYSRRVTVQRHPRAVYNFLLTLRGWTPGTDLRAVAADILATLDASTAGARIRALTDTVLWLDVEAD